MLASEALDLGDEARVVADHLSRKLLDAPVLGLGVGDLGLLDLAGLRHAHHLEDLGVRQPRRRVGPRRRRKARGRGHRRVRSVCGTDRGGSHRQRGDGQDETPQDRPSPHASPRHATVVPARDLRAVRSYAACAVPI